MQAASAVLNPEGGTPSVAGKASPLRILVGTLLPASREERLFALLTVNAALDRPSPAVSRAVMAQALNMILFDDLLARVPDAEAYAADCLAAGQRIFHDHGAVRTVVLDGMGSLPSGEAALTRILTPLGYALAGVYPLDGLKMTGRSYAQSDHPQDIAQFFVSELHVDRFSPRFQAAAHAITKASSDPLTPTAARALETFATAGSVTLDQALAALPSLVLAFGRQHQPPSLANYATLAAESAEMAWIATEGNVFNHATDRVPDVEATAAAQKALGRAMKDRVEVARDGRVRQTAFLAAQVRRTFTDGERTVERVVPGSFYEFITRLPEGGPAGDALDLAFDSANAQAIFKMTKAQTAL